MKIVFIALLLLIASFCIDAKCPKCNADSCLGCTKHSNCVWCDGNCQSKTAKIFCTSRIEEASGCAAGCDYNGKHYSVGEEFMDDCNTCTCNEDGTASCTLMLCTPGCEAVLCPVDTYCEEDENGHPVCKPFDEENPCNLIDCGDGKVCYIKEDGTADCKDDPCMSTKCGWGEICVTNTDGTPTCVKPSTCDYNGVTYQDGDSFPSDDGCNQCSCTSGRVICTLRACTAPDCQTNEDCESGFYCKKDSCDTLKGFCSPSNDICTAQHDPVCGCDGKTYGNDCEAASAGVNIKNDGECEGGSQSECQSHDDCESGNYCKKDSCDDSQKGSCALRTDFCTKQYDPVCGCDGKTYGNDCEAAGAGVSVDYEGECEGESQNDCQSHDECGSGRYCQKDSCDDSQNGFCADRNEFCTAQFDPVCGCDGQTYGNDCEAASAGVNIKSEGECEGGSQNDCQSHDECGSGRYCKKDSCDDSQKGSCADRNELCTEQYDPVCGCDGQTYGNECQAAAAGVNINSYGECEGGSQNDCQSHDDCESGNYCKKDSCDDSQKGSCELRTEMCTEQYDPVCGCDGKTYGNDCEAAGAGVSIKSEGECEGESQDDCESNDDCDTGYFCAKNSCDAADGTCTKKIELCTALYDPVCGCDNHTYGNSCSANNAGVNIKSVGECKQKQNNGGHMKTDSSHHV